MLEALKEIMMKSRIFPVMVCSCCYEKLWAVRLYDEDSLGFVPASIEVPNFSRKTTLCPFCGQDYLLRASSFDGITYVDEYRHQMGMVPIPKSHEFTGERNLAA